MAFEKTKIRSVSNATIVLSNMDTDNKDINLGFGGGYQTKKSYGYEFPYIIINERRFLKEEIGSLEIDCTNFLPIVHFTLLISDTLFLAQKLPKDGDILSIYIRSYDDVYKPIRNDYLITHVESVGLTDSSLVKTFYITGILNIKKIWVEQNKAFKGTSLDVLKK